MVDFRISIVMQGVLHTIEQEPHAIGGLLLSTLQPPWFGMSIPTEAREAMAPTMKAISVLAFAFRYNTEIPYFTFPYLLGIRDINYSSRD